MQENKDANEKGAVQLEPAPIVWRTREVPLEWEARLREISPATDVTSWLSLRWHPDFQRWIVYECVPAKYIIDNELIADLGGADPDSEAGRDILVSRYQQEMFRKFRVHARPCWIIQGANGGHQVDYDEATKELMRANNLPTEAPLPGALPYAPFDERVVRQLLRMSKLMKAKNSLSEFKRTFGTTEGHKREYNKALKLARAEYLKYINEQFSESTEHFIDAANTGELDGHKRTDTNWEKLDEESDEKYLQTGRF